MPKKLSSKMIMIFFLIFLELAINIGASHFAIEAQRNHMRINEFLETQRNMIKDVASDTLLLKEVVGINRNSEEVTYVKNKILTRVANIEKMFDYVKDGRFRIEDKEFAISLDKEFEDKLAEEFERAYSSWSVLKSVVEHIIEDDQDVHSSEYRFYHLRESEKSLIQIESDISKMCRAEMITVENKIQKLQNYSMAAAILIFFAMIYIMTKGLYLPIKELKNQIKTMSSGDFEKRLKSSREDEFAELYEDVNIFMDTMQNLFNLEDKIILENDLDSMLNYINDNFKNFMKFKTVGIFFRTKENEGHVRKIGNDEMMQSKVRDIESCMIDKMTIENSMIKIPIIIDKSNLGFVFFLFEKEEDIKENYIAILKLIKNKLAMAFYKSLLSRDLLAIVTDSLAELSEGRDNETGMHLKRMAKYSKIIARRLYEKGEFKDTIDWDFVERIRITAPMHDIGKVAIPDSVLLKPGKLTDDEFDVMKTHANEGRKVLENLNNKFQLYNIDYFKMGEDIAGFHHEKYDGSGYPHSASGDDIPLSARICAVADVFDALTSKRPYKRAFSIEESCNILKESSGSHFDPVVLEAFFESMKEVREVYEKYGDEMDISA